MSRAVFLNTLAKSLWNVVVGFLLLHEKFPAHGIFTDISVGGGEKKKEESWIDSIPVPSGYISASCSLDASCSPSLA